MRTIIAVAVAAVALAAGGCTPQEPGKRSSSSTPSASASYRNGERTPGSVRDACTAVTKKSLARLGLGGAPRHRFGPNTCNWGDPVRSVRHVLRDLRVMVGAVEPTEQSTATEAATRAFGRLHGFEGDRKHSRDVQRPVPARDLGDQAKLARRWSHSPKRAAVSLMVRTGNVIVTVEMREESSTASAYRRIGSQAELEKDVLAAAEDVLGRLGKRSPSPAATPSVSYPPHEIRRVLNVCSAVDDGARLVPGAPSRDIRPAHTTAAGGCYWEAGEPSLVVQVEASAPRAYTGESGTDVARQLTYLAHGKRATKLPDGADEAKTDYSVSKKYRYRFANLVVRRANLVVAVEYQNWAEPSKRQMQRDAVRVAEEVLAEYA